MHFYVVVQNEFMNRAPFNVSKSQCTMATMQSMLLPTVVIVVGSVSTWGHISKERHLESIWFDQIADVCFLGASHGHNLQGRYISLSLEPNEEQPVYLKG